MVSMKHWSSLTQLYVAASLRKKKSSWLIENQSGIYLIKLNRVMWIILIAKAYDVS